ncbi:unnamed protein product [Moneuplotes crassus]|uniref:Uncharacterized protein n=1 Tax=Euplotes crassus TaxID=5936 RepID=A0AAD1XR33_EUPCR|nr:unnamed protein product [Moneuplotes crassus]
MEEEKKNKKINDEENLEGQRDDQVMVIEEDLTLSDGVTLIGQDNLFLKSDLKTTNEKLDYHKKYVEDSFRFDPKWFDNIDARLERIEATQDDILKKVTERGVGIKILDGKVDGVLKSVSAIARDGRNLDTKVADLTNGQLELHTKLEALDTKIEALATAQKEMNQSIDCRINGLEAKIDGLALKIDGYALKMGEMLSKIFNIVQELQPAAPNDESI